MPWFFSSLRISRSAALLSRRLWTSMSSTSPSLSTARHRYICRPAIFTNISSRCQTPLDGPRRRRRRLRDQRPEASDPDPDRLVGHDDTALGEKFLDIAQAQREAQIEPNRVLDDRLREPEAVVRSGAHAGRLPLGNGSGKPNLTVPADQLPSAGLARGGAGRGQAPNAASGRRRPCSRCATGCAPATSGSRAAASGAPSRTSSSRPPCSPPCARPGRCPSPCPRPRRSTWPSAAPCWSGGWPRSTPRPRPTGWRTSGSRATS